MSDAIRTSTLQRQKSIDSLSDDGISAVDSNDVGRDDPLSDDNIIAKKETKNELRLKLLVLFILLVSTLTIASCVYVYITNSEISQFEAKFSNDAAKVLEAIGSSLHRTLGLMDSLSVTLVTHALAQNDTWPFVTLPGFGARMAKMLPLTDAHLIQLLPIVSPENRNEWESYSLKNDDWVNQSIALQDTWSGYYGPTDYGWEPYGTIFGDNGDIEANVSRIMLPIWQNFPVITEVVSAYNWDYQAMLNPEPQDVCISSRRSTLSRTYMIPNPSDPISQAESEGWIDWIADFLPPDEITFEPIVDLFYPIINDVSRIDLSTISKETAAVDDNVVALLTVNIYWRNFIRGILPFGSNGIVVVVESPCNEVFSYQITGPDVNFLGVGDAHDVEYQHLAKSSTLVDLKKISLRDAIYSGVPLDEDVCPYNVHIYPSDLMKSDFKTMNGVVFMISTISIFLFTSLVFFLYDWKVQRRQNRVASSAMQSSNIVSSLFPATVRDQLYETQCDVPLSNDQKAESITASPIAQLYTDTSVIFMDIVGFTQWSSARQPAEVFQLLETIYARFDALAKVLGVFKIETIGDSYVAVVGLPSKRKRHAVIMARFAYDCRESMTEMMTQLEEKLGQGTSDLKLRIGIHSGPTTAGVLRGEKARFQLFGDTVNTAARMESNSKPNKIQVSATTAELIQNGGYGHWLTERPDKVMAKGKGLMQTYWCEPVAVDGKSTESVDRQLLNF